jgi:hypothetical protein
VLEKREREREREREKESERQRERERKREEREREELEGGAGIVGYVGTASFGGRTKGRGGEVTLFLRKDRGTGTTFCLRPVSEADAEGLGTTISPQWGGRLGTTISPQWGGQCQHSLGTNIKDSDKIYWATCDREAWSKKEKTELE